MRNLYHTCMFSTLIISFSEVWPRQTVCLMDVLKTSLIYPCNMSWRCLEDVFAKRLEDVFKTFLQDVLKTYVRRIYWSWSRRLENVFKTSSEEVWLRRIYSSWLRRLEDVLRSLLCPFLIFFTVNFLFLRN